MLGSLSIAPHEFRYALDALMPLIASVQRPFVICNLPELQKELDQRGLGSAQVKQADAAVWVEPLQASWQMQLQQIGANLATNAPLLIVASRPLARVIPECHSWNINRLGLQVDGIFKLKQALRSDFTIEAEYGFHTLAAIGLNMLGSRLTTRKPVLADRLHFAGRMQYQTRGSLATFSTVALIVARKKV